METPTFNKMKLWKKVLLIFLASLCTVVILIGLGWMNKLHEENLRLVALQGRISDSVRYATENQNRILQNEIDQYKNNQALYLSITALNKATDKLKYKAGDIVYCKPDSTRAMVFNVLVGGSKYHYFIRYEVQLEFNGELIKLSPHELY